MHEHQYVLIFAWGVERFKLAANYVNEWEYATYSVFIHPFIAVATQNTGKM